MFRSRLWVICLLLAIVLAGIGSAVFQRQPLVHAAAVLTVTTTADTAPPCKAPAFSLRCAITQANTDGSGDTIMFNIAPAGNTCFGSPQVCTIGLSRSLPVLTASHTTINGYTQPGARPNSNALSSGDNAVLTIQIDNPTLTQGFDALDITGSNNTIEGLNISQMLINPVRVGGNALFLEAGANNNLVAGNFFGVSPDGSAVEPNTNDVMILGNTNLIGGTTPASANVVSGSYASDIEVEGNQNTIEGNLVGTNAAGTKALGAGTGKGNWNILVDSGSNNTIGGTISGAGNVISGDPGPGVAIYYGDANAILGNLIGTNAADTAAIPNGTGSRASSRGGVNIVGPNVTVSGNVISGNKGGGVLIQYPSAVVSANFIGVTATGQPLGNSGDGVDASAYHPSISSGTIGGTGPGAGNIIASNTGSGVLVGPASITSTHVAINGNSIFANGGLGIDLLPQGVVNCNTPPPGPNDYLPCPIITSATKTKVSGTACASCLVEVYIATNERDDLGHGEGKTFLGSITAGANGKWSLTLSPGQVSKGQRVTATATTTSTPLETSEFAANVVVTS